METKGSWQGALGPSLIRPLAWLPCPLLEARAWAGDQHAEGAEAGDEFWGQGPEEGGRWNPGAEVAFCSCSSVRMCVQECVECDMPGGGPPALSLPARPLALGLGLSLVAKPSLRASGTLEGPSSGTAQQQAAHLG